MTAIVTLEFWIGLLTGLSIMSLIWVKMLRRHYRNIVTIKKAERDLESLISQIYHKDIYPELCRVEGLLRLSEMFIGDIIKTNEEVKQNCNIAEQPEHYKYYKLVRLGIEKLETQLKELKGTAVVNGIKEITTLKQRFQDIINKYNS